MNDNAYLKCIDPKCGLEYAITSGVLECEKGHILDVKYNKIPSRALKELFYTGYLKSIVKISTDDPYDVDSFIVSSENDAVFPLELKEKSPVFKKSLTFSTLNGAISET